MGKGIFIVLLLLISLFPNVLQERRMGKYQCNNKVNIIMIDTVMDLINCSQIKGCGELNRGVEKSVITYSSEMFHSIQECDSSM